MSAKYDPRVLQTFADRLYAKADAMARECAVAGMIMGLIAGFIIGLIPGRQLIIPPAIPAILGAVVGAVVGYFIGESRSFHYRLEAQRTLLQMQIESNTRRE